MYVLGIGTIALAWLCGWIASRGSQPAPIQGWSFAHNMPAKLRLLVLLVGFVAFLVYADHRALLPPRVVLFFYLTPLFAVAALVSAWSHTATANRGVLMQAGAVAVFLLTLGAGTAPHGPGAFLASSALLLVVVCAGVGVLALVLGSLAQAVLGLLAGLAVPVLAGLAHGAAAALFSSLVVLHAAMLITAWRRRWQLSRWLGVVGACNVGVVWGVLAYRPELADATLFFLLLVALGYVFAIGWRSAPSGAWIDAGLLTLVSVCLQGSLLVWWRQPLSTSAIVAAAIYLGMTWRKRYRPEAGATHLGWAALTAIFTALAACLVWRASLGCGVCAAAGAWLIWLGWREHSRALRTLGVVMHALANLSLIIVFHPAPGHYWQSVFNREFFCTLLFVTVCGAFNGWRYQREANTIGGAARMAAVLCGCSLLVWLVGASLEIHRVFSGQNNALMGLWLLLVVTACVAAEVAHYLPTVLLGRLMAFSAALLSALTLVAVAWCFKQDWQPLSGRLLVPVIVMGVLGWYTLSCFKAYRRLAIAMQLLWWCRWALIAGVAALVALHDSRWLSDTWRWLFAMAPTLVLWWMLTQRWQWLAEPLPACFASTRALLVPGLTVIMSGLFVVGLIANGNAAPLPYLPLLNPLELMLVAVLAGAACAFSDDALPRQVRNARCILLGMAWLALSSSAGLRAVHQLTGVPWTIGALAGSGLAQSSLAVIGAVFGILLWANRRMRQRRDFSREHHHDKD